MAEVAKAKKPRQETLSKDDLIEALHPRVQAWLGTRVSKALVWDLFKDNLNVAFSLGKEKPLSLAGVGKFYSFSSKRSEKSGKPAKRMRFKPSSRVNDQLNKGESFLEALPEVKDAAAASAAAVSARTEDAVSSTPVVAEL